MLEITVETERGERLEHVSAEELGRLVRRIGARADRFLVLGRTPEQAGVFAQLWHESGGAYTLEHREGTADRHFRTSVDRPEPVVAALEGWARRSPGWDTGLEWTPLEADATEARRPESPDAVPASPDDPAALDDPDEPDDPDDLDALAAFDDLDAEEREELEERIREALVAGYTDLDDLLDLVEEHLEEELDDSLPDGAAQALVERRWRERLAEQAGWRGETDPERLTRAFVALEAAGITAREHFTCCRTCGNAEIGAERAPGSRGFVYFHTQSTERAAGGGGLTLHYGGFDGSESTTVAVGREIVAAAESVGLTSDWDGSPDRAILLSPLEWRRRLEA
ncbi:hypothetical protein MTQ01_20590 [Streptomyces sp. XM4193]|uniref:DUF6891 domain-containing protein n=1 Tax=Streptomyces sp. XM4193 TaxID=2929782 RepID=UPI001FFB1EA5|nr:hypothetical protein [Streptomyces sp. XM4193]MCK1798380.1 hypothetical protein [Streptomyces sp. XM4193]